MSGSAESSSTGTAALVHVHPTALLSIADHYNRQAKNTSRRVVGTLLGEHKEDGIHVLSAFAVPFEEDVKDPRVFFVDHNYHEAMFDLHRKVNPREKVVGWYSSHGSIKPCDISIHESVFKKYVVSPVFLCVDVLASTSLQLPIKAYTSETSGTGVFAHVDCRVDMLEAEEVGVEHLLRDLTTAAQVTDLSFQVDERMNGVKLLQLEIEKILKYLDDVCNNKLPVNHAILKILQNVLGALGDKFADNADLKKTLNLENNDAAVSMYVGALLRTTVSLHNLIDNKLKLRTKDSKDAVKPAPTAVEAAIGNKDDKVEASDADLHAHFFSHESLELLVSIFYNNTSSTVCDASLGEDAVFTQSVSYTPNADVVVCFAVTCTRAGQNVKDGNFEISVSSSQPGTVETFYCFQPENLRAPEVFQTERLLSGRGASSTLHNLVAGSIASTPALFLGAVQNETSEFRLAGIRCVSGSPPSVALEIQSLLKCGLGNLRSPDNSPERNLVRKSGILQGERSRANTSVDFELQRKNKRISELEDQVRVLKKSLAAVTQEKNTLLSDFSTLLKKAIDEKLHLEDLVEGGKHRKHWSVKKLLH